MVFHSRKCTVKTSGSTEDGFTLVEVVASLLILTTIAISLFSFIVDNARDSKSGNNRVAAVNLAKMVIQSYESQDFTTLKNKANANSGLGTTEPVNLINLIPSTATHINVQQFQATVTITNDMALDAATRANMVTLRVNVQSAAQQLALDASILRR